MSIGAIDGYTLPVPEEIASNRVDWTIDPSRGALLIHDMQNYFVDAYGSGVDPISTVVRNIAAIRRKFIDRGMPVIYTMQPGDQHPARRGLLAEFWGRGLSAGRDTEVVTPLAPGPDDIQVVKWRYSAFQRTDLRALLARHGRDQLVVTGVYAHMGCLLSSAEAFMSDIEPFFVLDATADFSRDEHVMAADYVAKRCGVVLTAGDVADQLSTQAESEPSRVGIIL